MRSARLLPTMLLPDAARWVPGEKAEIKKVNFRADVGSENCFPNGNPTAQQQASPSLAAKEVFAHTSIFPGSENPTGT